MASATLHGNSPVSSFLMLLPQRKIMTLTTTAITTWRCRNGLLRTSPSMAYQVRHSVRCATKTSSIWPAATTQRPLSLACSQGLQCTPKLCQPWKRFGRDTVLMAGCAWLPRQGFAWWGTLRPTHTTAAACSLQLHACRACGGKGGTYSSPCGLTSFYCQPMKSDACVAGPLPRQTGAAGGCAPSCVDRDFSAAGQQRAACVCHLGEQNNHVASRGHLGQVNRGGRLLPATACALGQHGGLSTASQMRAGPAWRPAVSLVD